MTGVMTITPAVPSAHVEQRVLYVGYDLFSVGGIQRYSQYELRALRELVSPGAIRACSLLPPDRQLFDSPDVALTGGGRSAAAKVAFGRAVMREARAHAARLIICDHISLAPVAFLAARAAGAALCVNVYGLEVWGPLLPWRRAALGAADVIVSDCHFTRRHLEQRFVRLAGRIRVVEDCVDVDRFQPGAGDEALRQQLGLRLQPVVLTVSRLARGRSKGHRAVLAALAELRREGLDFTYLVVGDGDDLQPLKDHAAKLGVADSVVFAGALPDDVLPSAYRLCDVFVLASGFKLGRRAEGEGVPLVVLEAQASGKPCITSRLDGSAESLVDGETGWLVDPNDVGEIGAALRRLLLDDRARREMGDAARRFAVKRFSYEVFRDLIDATLLEHTGATR
jgi:phosphatidylinositol alpha-1,6-mannosyltransferase